MGRETSTLLKPLLIHVSITNIFELLSVPRMGCILPSLQVFAHALLFFWNAFPLLPPLLDSQTNSHLLLKTHVRHHLPCEASQTLRVRQVPSSGSPGC